MRGFGLVCLLLVITAVQSLAGGQPQSAPPIAVLEFDVIDDRGLDFSWARLGLTDLLQLELQKHGVQTLDRDFVRAVMNEQRRQVEGATKGDLSLGRLLSARCLVRGNLVVLADNRIRLSATAVTVPENQVLSAASAEGLFPDELSLVIAALGSNLATHLREPGGAGATPSGTTNGYLPSPETLVIFYKGIDLCAQGFPEHAVGWFICAGMLDPRFVQAGLWERKAYQMAGFPHHAALVTNGLSAAAVMNARQQAASAHPSIRTVAVLEPLIAGSSTSTAAQSAAAAERLRSTIEEALLRTEKVRVFNPQTISSVLGELDLHLSAGFAAQSLPLYDKWLVLDGLLFCSVSETNVATRMSLEILDAISGAVVAHREAAIDVERSVSLNDALIGVLADWSARKTPLARDPSRVGSAKALPARLQEKFAGTYVDLGRALAAVRQGEDQHRQLYDLFMTLGRTSNAVWELNYVLDNAMDGKDPAAWLSAFGWALDKPLAPVAKRERLGDLVVANAPESADAAQVWFWRGMYAYNRRDWNTAADYLLHASRIHRQIDTPDAVPPYDYVIYRSVCLMSEPASEYKNTVSVFYNHLNPQPTVRADEVPWTLFEPFGDHVVADSPNSLAARCVWYNRGTRAFELKQWTNAIQCLEQALDKITDDPECSAVLTEKGQFPNRVWVASGHCLAAFSAAELELKEQAKRHLDEAEDWMVRSGIGRDNPMRMFGSPEIWLYQPAGRQELNFGTYSRDSIWTVLAAIRTRLNGQEMKRSDESPDFELWLRRFDSDLHTDNRTPEQFAAIGSNSLALLKILITDWKARPAEPYRTGAITNMPFALGFLSIARQTTCAIFPVPKVRHLGSTPLLRPPMATMSLASCTNPAVPLLKQAAESATAAYRLARGLQQMDAGTNVPTPELLTYHREAVALLSAAGFKPDLVREFDLFFRPPHLSLVLLPGILEQCGVDAATCDRIVRDAVTSAGSTLDAAPRSLFIFLGDRFISERRYQDAMEWYRKAVKGAEEKNLYINTEWDLMIGLCRCAASLSCVSEAEAFMNTHLRDEKELERSHQQQATIWLASGRQCQNAGDDEAALLCYEKTRQLTKDTQSWASASYHAAHLLRRRGRKEESAALWKELAAAIPTDEVAILDIIRATGTTGFGVKVGEEARRMLALFRQGLGGPDRQWRAFNQDVIGYLAKVPKPGDRAISVGITEGPARGCVWEIQIKYLRSEDLEYLKSHDWRPETE